MLVHVPPHPSSITLTPSRIYVLFLPGVTHLPEVLALDLRDAFASVEAAAVAAAAAPITATAGGGAAEAAASGAGTAAVAAAAPPPHSLAGSLLSIVLSTDGVWDNWYVPPPPLLAAHTRLSLAVFR